MSVSIFDRAQTSARFIRERINTQVDVAVVLGSGLGVFAETLEDKIIVPYEEIPDFARSTVEGHSGRLVVGKLPGAAVNVAVMQGRFHYYEGYSLDEVTLPIRAFNAMGVEKLVLTNAAGSLALGLETNDGIAGTLLGIERYGLGFDYISRYPDLIRGISAEQIVEVARKYLSTENYIVVTAGPAVS